MLQMNWEQLANDVRAGIRMTDLRGSILVDGLEFWRDGNPDRYVGVRLRSDGDIGVSMDGVPWGVYHQNNDFLVPYIQGIIQGHLRSTTSSLEEEFFNRVGV